MTYRILITGGAGFIGVHLASQLLELGHQILLVDNYTRGVKDSTLEQLLDSPRVSLSEINLLKREEVLSLGEEFEVIFHLAATVGVMHVMSRPYHVLSNNVIMLDNIVDLARRQSSLHRFLFASTSEVYAGTLKYFSLNIPTPENVPLAAMNLRESRTSYMLSKIYGEAMCHQSELPFTIFRPHNIYGPRMGMSHVIPEQLHKVWKTKSGGIISVYSPEHTRTFCYIDDAVEMLKRMIESDKCIGQTLNVGAESPEISIRELVQSCIDLSSKKLEMEFLPATRGSPVRRAPNMKRTRELLNFSSEIELKKGLQRTWDWYKDRVFQKCEITAK